MFVQAIEIVFLFGLTWCLQLSHMKETLSFFWAILSSTFSHTTVWSGLWKRHFQSTSCRNLRLWDSTKVSIKFNFNYIHHMSWFHKFTYYPWFTHKSSHIWDIAKHFRGGGLRYFRYVPLANIAPGGQDEFEVWNSPLNEGAVLGFEYGASLGYKVVYFIFSWNFVQQMGYCLLLCSVCKFLMASLVFGTSFHQEFICSNIFKHMSRVLSCWTCKVSFL